MLKHPFSLILKSLTLSPLIQIENKHTGQVFDFNQTFSQFSCTPRKETQVQENLIFLHGIYIPKKNR